MSSPPTPERSFTSASFAKLPSDEPPGRIPCTFASCKFFFQNTAAMKRHKSTSPDHEYCEKCDLDCETEDQLLIHKIKSNKHIVCPVCGIEFGSEGGRDRHIRLNHRTAQNLTCPGCNDTFRSAAGMVRHVENGDCTAISQKRLLLEQSKKLMRKEALEIAEACMAASMTPSIVDVDEDGAGGVVLPMTIGESNREAMANQPGGVSGSLIDDHWPGLPGTEETGLDDIMGVMALKDAAKKSAKDSDKENERWKGKGREHSGASGTGSGSAGGSVSASSVGAPSGSIGPPDMALVLRRIYKDFDAANFLDGFTGEYVCPCGRRCSTKEGFEKHVLAKSQGSRRMECPGCLRSFNSTSALVAHWESATLRCDIKDGNSYGQIMDEVSGGLVQIAGFNDDGTVKYEAGKLELQKKITVGVDLDKFGW